MNYDSTIWNGYAVHGDVAALDEILSNPGMIAIDRDDVIDVLKTDSQSYVATGTGASIGEAFDKAVSNLPKGMEGVSRLLIDFRCGSDGRQPSVPEIAGISMSLSEAVADIDVKWGISSDESLGESFKLILLASLK